MTMRVKQKLIFRILMLSAGVLATSVTPALSKEFYGDALHKKCKAQCDSVCSDFKGKASELGACTKGCNGGCNAYRGHHWKMHQAHSEGCKGKDSAECKKEHRDHKGSMHEKGSTHENGSTHE